VCSKHFTTGENLSLKENPSLEPRRTGDLSTSRPKRARVDEETSEIVPSGECDELDSADIDEALNRFKCKGIQTDVCNTETISVKTQVTPDVTSASVQTTESQVLAFMGINNSEKQFKFYTGFDWTMFKVKS
jgi:hypothetical protein